MVHMKNVCVLLFCSLNMLAMDLKMPGESDINWDEDTFKSAWIDPTKMITLNSDFDVHTEFLVGCGVAEEVFKSHHDKCTCLGDDASDVSACIRFQKLSDDIYEPKAATNKSNVPALRALLGVKQPSVRGALMYAAIRKASYALAYYTINAYLSAAEDDSTHYELAIPFLPEEKTLLEQEVLPLLDPQDAMHLKWLIISPVSRLEPLRKIDAGDESPVVARKALDESSSE